MAKMLSFDEEARRGPRQDRCRRRRWRKPAARGRLTRQADGAPDGPRYRPYAPRA